MAVVEVRVYECWCWARLNLRLAGMLLKVDVYLFTDLLICLDFDFEARGSCGSGVQVSVGED